MGYKKQASRFYYSFIVAVIISASILTGKVAQAHTSPPTLESLSTQISNLNKELLLLKFRFDQQATPDEVKRDLELAIEEKMAEIENIKIQIDEKLDQLPTLICSGTNFLGSGVEDATIPHSECEVDVSDMVNVRVDFVWLDGNNWQEPMRFKSSEAEWCGVWWKIHGDEKFNVRVRTCSEWQGDAIEYYYKVWQ